MTVTRKALARLLRNPLTWLIVAVVAGTLIGWATASASGGEGQAQLPPGRTVSGAIAGLDVLLPSPDLAPSTPPGDG